MEKANEQTFIMIKPDGVCRGLVGKIIERFECKGFSLIAMKMMKPTKAMTEKLYEEHKTKPFFGELMNYLQTGPMIMMVWQGMDVTRTTRKMIGEIKPLDSLPGTIRGDLCIDVARNLIHGSESMEMAKKEIAMWFTPAEMFTCCRSDMKMIYE